MYKFYFVHSCLCVSYWEVLLLYSCHITREDLHRVCTFKTVYQLHGCLGKYVTLSEKIAVPIYREDVKQNVPFNTTVQRRMHGVIFHRILL